MECCKEILRFPIYLSVTRDIWQCHIFTTCKCHKTILTFPEEKMKATFWASAARKPCTTKEDAILPGIPAKLRTTWHHWPLSRSWRYLPQLLLQKYGSQIRETWETHFLYFISTETCSCYSSILTCQTQRVVRILLMGAAPLYQGHLACAYRSFFMHIFRGCNTVTVRLDSPGTLCRNSCE